MKDKWKILVTSSIVGFAAEFFTDVPSALSRRLTGVSPSCTDGSDHCLNISNFRFNALFAASSFSTAVGAVVAAVIISKYGKKGTVWASSLLMFLGSVVFAAGSHTGEAIAYPMLITGRILHGIGNGASITTANTMISNAWDSQASAMGWYLLWSRAGSAMNYAINGGILAVVGMSGCLWIAVGFTTVGSLAGLILGCLDDGGEPFPENDSLMTNLWKFLKNAKAIFWSFTLMFLLVHSTVSTFTSNGPSLLGMTYGHTESEASYTIGIVNDLAIFIPLVGFCVDLVGKRDYWMAGGTLFISIAFASYLGSCCFHSVALAIFVGFGYILFDPTSNTSISCISSNNSERLARGVAIFFRYTGVGIFSLFAGIIVDTQDGNNAEWTHLIVLLLVLSLCSLVAAIALVIFNQKNIEQPLTPNREQTDRAKGDTQIHESTKLISRELNM